MTPVLAPTVSSTESECRDLQSAAKLQRTLLPASPFTWTGWTAAHSYTPAGSVSGDYLDLVPNGDRLYFMLGDVSGKGVLASLLMAQLHAMFRTLIPFQLSIDDLMARASRLLCESSLPAQYATLVFGYADAGGEVVIANAGHPPPLVVTAGLHTEVHATGVPIGMFCESTFSSSTVHLTAGDTLLLFSDGLTEGRNLRDEEYGRRVERTALGLAKVSVADLVDGLLADHASFREGRPNTDDVTVLAIRRS